MSSAGGDVSRETSHPLPQWASAAQSGLEAYASLLATVGVERGLIGPREVPRIWDRHILNCLVVADPELGLVPTASRVADVGSGAGLPGLVWALARPDIEMILVEPLLRRSTFLQEATAALGVASRVQVDRTRAEDARRNDSWQPVDIVTARAVAPLERLLGWTLPLLRPGGRLVALKGSSALDEITAAAQVTTAMGLHDVRVVTCGEAVVDPATSVVVGEWGTAQ